MMDRKNWPALPDQGYDATRCPRCGRTGYAETSRTDAQGFRIRHRVCEPCGARWRTVELDAGWIGASATHKRRTVLRMARGGAG